MHNVAPTAANMKAEALEDYSALSGYAG